MHPRFLAIFTWLKEQLFDSTLELDCQGDILSKTFPAPEKIDSGALSLYQGGALECEGESCVRGFESTCHITPGMGQIMSLNEVHNRIKIKILINERICQWEAIKCAQIHSYL